MQATNFAPVKVIECDVARPLSDIDLGTGIGSQPYGAVFCLVRNDGRPVSVAEFAVEDGLLCAETLRQKIGTPQPRFTAPSSVARAKSGEFPPLTVVIATRDRAASLDKCLQSILAQDYAAFEIVVVDNAPATSDTQELVANRYATGNKVRYVREDRAGLGRAHNAALPHIHTALAVFTDDDVIADRNWLAALAGSFMAEDNVGCVTGLILPAELETRAQLWTERHGGFGKGFSRKVFDLGENRPDHPLFPFTAGQFGSGANMAFSMEALRQIGGFDSALGAGTKAKGGDDLASFYAVVNAGFKLVYEPEAIVWHHHRRGEEGMVRQAFGYGMGLGAYLTKLVVEDPMVAWRLLRRLRPAVAHMFGASSPKVRRLPGDYPAALVWRERLGILAGVPGYLRSRRATKLADAARAMPGGPLVAAPRNRD